MRADLIHLPKIMPLGWLTVRPPCNGQDSCRVCGPAVSIGFCVNGGAANSVSHGLAAGLQPSVSPHVHRNIHQYTYHWLLLRKLTLTPFPLTPLTLSFRIVCRCLLVLLRTLQQAMLVLRCARGQARGEQTENLKYVCQLPLDVNVSRVHTFVAFC